MTGGRPAVPPPLPPRPARPARRSRVTELSFGGAAIGNLFTAVSDDDARAAVDAAWDGGIRTFDTAPHYGLGLSERRLGDALRHRPRDEYVICTKVGRLLDPAVPARRHRRAATPRASPSPPATSGGSTTAPTASGAAWRRAWTASAWTGSTSRSSTIPTTTASRRSARPTRRWSELRAEGVVRAIGAGMNQAAMLTRFVTDTDVDVVLVAGRYTLLDQSAARRAAAGGAAPRRVGHRRRSVQLGPARRPRRGRDLRLPARRPAELIERARRLAETCARFGVPLRAAAARFPLTHPAVASVLIGARSAAEISDAIALRALDIPAALWDSLATSDERGQS